MNPMRGLAAHGAIFAVAALFAYRTWTYDESKEPKHGETELWPGTPDQVQQVEFEAKGGSLTLEPHQDTNGRYFVGEVKKPPGVEVKSPNSSEPAPPPKVTDIHFIAVKEGQDLLETLAPLRALRVLGKVTGNQQTEFGFDKEEGKLRLREGGKEHTLVFGASTPGGSDYYVKDAATGDAYVVAGSIYRDLSSADSRLVEHNLHGFESSAVERVKLTAGSASRELVRSASKKDAWTKPVAPNDHDDTATNFITKLERLHTVNYEGETLNPPPTAADLVIKVEYFDAHKQIGFLELVRRPPIEKSDKPEYAARTEHTRWYATVIRSAAEQLDQDVKSVLTP
jgi:hypothetical protein